MNITKEYIETEYLVKKLNIKDMKKLNIKDIAKKCGVKQKRVWYLMTKYNIPRRKKSEIGAHELSGKIFGMLKVNRRALIEECPIKNKGTYWICTCNCGKECIVKGNSLVGRYTGSCGCLWKKSKFEEIPGEYLSRIKRNAANRKLTFKVSAQFLWNLFLEQGRKCALSKVDISFGKKNRSSASLDRINSKLGYEEGNVQWVHKLINQMKMDMTQMEFLKWAGLIALENKINP